MQFSKNDKIAIYTVTFPHKQSTYAETYRVKDAQGRTCFLKLINYSKLNRDQIDDHGKILEVEIARQCHHRNLCACIDTGNILLNGGQQAYLVTEYVSGETLSQKVSREGALSVYDIKQIAIHILLALQHLHTLPRPAIHGEVTLQNVWIDLLHGWDYLKLIDYGHARYMDMPPSKADLQALNPFYLAPERFAGVAQVQTDLYTVGALMYQLLYGKLPWYIDLSRINAHDRIDAVLEAREKELDLPALDKFEMDEQLENCIAKALAPQVEDRFQTAEEFIRGITGELTISCPSTKQKMQSNPPSSWQRPAATPKSGTGFAAIAGMDDLKARLQEEVIAPLHHPEEYRRYGITIPNGMLLYGPPGCGKTFFAKHFAEEVGFNFLCVTPSTLKSKYVNATQENIANMFKEAEEKAPTIIFIDEMNELTPNRENDVHEMSRSAVNEMLAQMDRTGERGIFIIGATNFPNAIDPAILRAGRLDRKYYIGAPDKEARKALFELYLKNRPCDFGLDYEALAELTSNYVSADFQLIVNDAARNALKQHSKITMDLLRSTISQTRPSLNPTELARYEQIKAQMDGNTHQPPRRRIGFV